MHSLEQVRGTAADPRGTILRGQSVSPGYGEGTAHVYHSRLVLGATPARRIDPPEIATERERLLSAIRSSIAELEGVRDRVLAEIGEAESQIIDSHLALLADPAFASRLRQRVEHDLVNAERAVEAETETMAKSLIASGNEYLRERRQDILDIGQRLLKHLGHGAASTLEQLPPHTVLVARELLPSDTLNLDRPHVAALALEYGASMSHAAILARSMGIPAVGSIPGLLNHVRDGMSLLVDGERGELVIDPHPAQILSFDTARSSYDRATDRALGDEWKECATADGIRISLLANLGRPEEVDQVRKHCLDGVGLFRTEYLFLSSDEPPGLEAQRHVYGSLVARLDAESVVIRVLDLGGDKLPRFSIPELRSRASARGLRLLLAESRLFRIQVQAILEASVDREGVSILLPMVVSGDDLKRGLDVIEDVAARVGRGTRPPIGAMIETPSALFELDEILTLSDFVSVGTNDLVQFMLAIERRNPEAFGADAIFQPSMLRALERVVKAAAAHDKALTLCGEAAGDPRAACLLVGMGFRKLSMSPVRSARVRAAIRSQHGSALASLTEQAIRSTSRDDVLRIVTSAISPNA